MTRNKLIPDGKIGSAKCAPQTSTGVSRKDAKTELRHLFPAHSLGSIIHGAKNKSLEYNALQIYCTALPVRSNDRVAPAQSMLPQTQGMFRPAHALCAYTQTMCARTQTVCAHAHAVCAYAQ